MYAMMQRRRNNPDARAEISHLAGSDCFPKLRQAPGLVALYVVAEADGTHTTGGAIWESQAQAEAFQAENDRWDQMREERGQRLASRGDGQVVGHAVPASRRSGHGHHPPWGTRVMAVPDICLSPLSSRRAGVRASGELDGGRA